MSAPEFIFCKCDLVRCITVERTHWVIDRALLKISLV